MENFNNFCIFNTLNKNCCFDGSAVATEAGTGEGAGAEVAEGDVTNNKTFQYEASKETTKNMDTYEVIKSY